MTYCPTCWRTTDQSDQFCRSCGTPLRRGLPPLQPPLPRPPNRNPLGTGEGKDSESEWDAEEAEGNGAEERQGGISFSRIVLLVLVLGCLAVFALSALGGGDDADLAQPRPGSAADVLCDSSSIDDPGIVRRGNKYYDEECLDTYSWTNPIGG